MSLARSVLFAAALTVITPPYALVALATFVLPRMARYRIISGWSRLVLFFAKTILGIDWRVEGRENLPSRPSVILAKHQSAWETLAFQHIFPPQVHVLKRELLWIPFFGWGLALMSPIAINRSRGAARNAPIIASCSAVTLAKGRRAATASATQGASSNVSPMEAAKSAEPIRLSSPSITVMPGDLARPAGRLYSPARKSGRLP